jgi:Uma2 family endonuclease
MSRDRTYIDCMPQAGLLTADQLLRLNIPDKRTELIRGALVVREPAGHRHGEVAAVLAHALVDYVRPRGLGRVYGAETGFILATDPDTVRAPDAAFVRRERLPEPDREGYATIAPDLAVEVLSPGDRPGEVLAKVADWLGAGTALVWVVDPSRQLARVYRADGSEETIGADGALAGEDVLPGFSVRLASLLTPYAY